jgi:uncharacterized repeat protein (TIGR01451 family)
MLNTHNTNKRGANFKWLAIVSVIGLSLITGLVFAITIWQRREESARQERIRQTLKENAETVRFLENKGQLPDKDVLYYFDAKQGSVYIERDQIRIVARDTEERPAQSISARADRKPLFKPGKDRVVKSQHSFMLRLDGSNPSPTIRRGEEFGARYNYFLGADPSKWAPGVRAAKELTLEDVYPGVDLRLYSTDDGSLEFDWMMDAGADFSQVKMSFEGQDSLSVDQDGSLKVGLRFTDVKFHLPESYQVTEQGKAAVNFAFNQSDADTIDFTANSPIDPRYPLVIDPTLTWGTFMDGDLAGFDQYLFAIQVDPTDGMVYCAGGTNQSIPTNASPYNADGFKNTVTGFSVTDALPRVAVVYRVTGDGTDLVDLTLYGPDSVSGSQQAVAYGLSLSSNRVFIGGRTTIDLPLAGTSFDGVRNGNDGYVAVFSRDLGTLHYATYLGSSGDENLGVTSIKALSDTSFVVGLTAAAALPAGPAAPDYITTGANLTFGGASDMYIARFSSLNALDWGTYVGGGGDEVFSDLEVFADGRVAFAGYGTGQLTEVNSAAGRSTNSDNEDGILGVLNSGGTAFNYLDEIGGAANDRIYDVEIVGATLYWTGAVSSGFPTSAGAYDTSHNGGLDVVVGSVSAAGSTGYAATFYGGSGDNIGNGIKPVVQTSCAGAQQSFLLVFGSTEGSIPTVNINNEPFYSPANNGGIDIFFAGFKGDLTAPLRFATNMGGVENDYLGDTGDTRGANHLWVSGANVYVGTTTHSPTHTPTLVSGGFDTVKSNTGNPPADDTHILFSIQFSSILESDYSDAPASYGAPAHVLDCANLRIGANLDPETGPLPTANADGDDNDKSPDDEDGLTTIPTFPLGGPQNISVTVNNVVNTTGGAATLYAWIDLDGDGQFESGEFASTAVANGFSGSKTLNWTGVTISGSLTSHYLRIRLTTDTLADNAGTAALDERSTVAALNGEVEDYRLTIVPVADLAITKTDGSATYTPGGTVTYTVVVTNNGPSGVTGAVVTDNKPPQVTSWAWACSNQSGGASGCTGAASSANNFSDTVDLPAGASITYTVTANIAAGATGDLVNTACVAPPQGTTDPAPGNNCDTDTDTPNPRADLAITKTDGVTTYLPGGTVIYTVVVTNNGPSNVTGAVVTDNKPPQVTTWAWACTNQTGGASGCTAAASSANNFSDTVDLPVGASITYTVTANIAANATGNLVNTACVAPPQGTTDPTPGNDCATDTDTPNPRADLAITKTDGSATYTPGGTVIYTVVVTNNGPSGVTGAVVTDNKPPQITTWAWACANQSGGASGCDGAASSANNFTDTVNLPVGASITYTVTANIAASATGDLVNTACVAPPQGTTDPTPGNNCATDTDTPTLLANLVITKTVNDPAAKSGDIVTFTVTVKNNGPASASDIKVEDILPPEFIFVSATASQGSYNSVTGIWTVGVLNAGASATLQVNVRVEFGCCPVTNTARIIESSAPDPNTGDNQASVTMGTPIGPGENLPASSEVSEQKAGSVLVYNLYTSSASEVSQNTRFNITNISQTTPVAVHMFFVDGQTCSVADMFLCLTKNQTVSFLASDLDPGTTGYVIAVAVDCNTGCPIYYNCLIGDEFVKLGSGHRANLGAEAISALTPDPAGCDENSFVATLRFDGVKYNRLPRALALSNIPSRGDGNDTMLILNRIGGDLTGSAAKLTNVFGIFYDDTENSLSFSFNPNLCQFRSSITSSFPRITPRFDQFVPKGRSGWLKLYSVDDQAVLGVAINSSGNVGGSAEVFNQGHNLHKLTVTSGATLVAPIFPPPCC